MGPLGLLSPQPGVSYLFSGDQMQKNAGNPIPGVPNQNQQSNPGSDMETMSGSLWSIANASNVPHGMVNVPPSWTNALGEMVLKIDGKLKVRRMTISPLEILNHPLENYIHITERPRHGCPERNQRRTVVA